MPVIIGFIIFILLAVAIGCHVNHVERRNADSVETSHD